METIAFASPLAPVAVFVLALRRDLVRVIAPVFFALAIGAALLAYVCATRDETPATVLASVAAVIAGGGLIAVILETDARLKATEGDELPAPTLPWRWGGRGPRWREFEGDFRAHVAILSCTAERRRYSRRETLARRRAEGSERQDTPPVLPPSEALFSFERRGRSALLVFVRSDHFGHLLEAAAYDPEDYL